MGESSRCQGGEEAQELELELIFFLPDDFGTEFALHWALQCA
jgi:hypothetical protein